MDLLAIKQVKHVSAVKVCSWLMQRTGKSVVQALTEDTEPHKFLFRGEQTDSADKTFQQKENLIYSGLL